MIDKEKEIDLKLRMKALREEIERVSKHIDDFDDEYLNQLRSKRKMLLQEYYAIYFGPDVLFFDR